MDARLTTYASLSRLEVLLPALTLFSKASNDQKSECLSRIEGKGDFVFDALKKEDAEVEALIQQEQIRQDQTIELIASENIVSQAVLEALGTVFTNKYAEGYPGRRYYGGCEVVDQLESLAQERAKKLFQCRYVNVQPHSGSQANQAVFLALLKPGEKILSLSLDAGGHLTHGSPVNLSGKWFEVIHYGVDPQTSLIDMNEVAELAEKHRPRLIIAGGSAYPRFIDFEAFRQIADATGSLLLADMAHIAGLVAGGVHPSPLPYAHVVTTTTHKTLRGPRGGMILSDDPTFFSKLDSALFPGLQGGPLLNVIAAKAVCFQEALRPSFKQYAQQVVDNAKALAQTLIESGFSLVSGGTDNHLILLTLQHVTGQWAERHLERFGIICNKNMIPNDPRSPQETSGIRLGTPAMTTRGFGRTEFQMVGRWISQLLNQTSDDDQAIRREVADLCQQFLLTSATSK